MSGDKPVRDFTKEAGVTVGMGFKGITEPVSAHCWHLQCQKEQRIRREWIRTYLPEQEKAEESMTQKFREEEVKTPGIFEQKERKLLLEGVSKEGGGRVAYLKARKELPPQQRYGDKTTASQAVGAKLRSGPPEWAQPSRWGKPM